MRYLPIVFLFLFALLPPQISHGFVHYKKSSGKFRCLDIFSGLGDIPSKSSFEVLVCRDKLCAN